MHWRASLAVAVAVLVGAAPAARAQSRLNVVVVPAAAAARTTSGPTVTVQNVFADPRSAELLSNGFQARVSVTVEVWANRTLFDDLLSQVTLDRVVRFDPLSKTYRVGSIVGDTVVEDPSRYASLDDVRKTMSSPHRVPLPAPAGRHGLYYVASVTIETLNSNDLTEVQRWLQGDVKPALKGNKNPGSALSRGLGTLVSRLLGGDVKRVVGRSELFDT